MSAPTPDLTRSLLERLRAGDAAGAQVLEEAYREPLLRFARGYLRDADEAEDAVQDVLARVLASDAEPESCRAWIYRVARNVCLNRLRARRPVEEHASALDPPEERTGPLTRLARAEERERLRDDLAELSDAQREAVTLRYVEGLTRDEIAAVLELPVSVVKSRIYEGLESLRREAGRRPSTGGS